MKTDCMLVKEGEGGAPLFCVIRFVALWPHFTCSTT